MAQIKSQIKRIRTNEEARQRNASAKSRVRTQVKKVRAAAAAKNLELARTELEVAYKYIDKNVSSGVYKKNTAARKKSDLAKLVNGLAE